MTSSAPTTAPHKFVSLGKGGILPVITTPEGVAGVYPEGLLEFYSNKTPEQVLKTWLANLPPPSMHDAIRDLVGYISGKGDIRGMILEGPPGLGKTTAGQWLIEMMGADGAMINCGNRSLSELAKETTVDDQSVDSVYSKIETLLKNGRMHPQSRRMLMAALEEGAQEKKPAPGEITEESVLRTGKSGDVAGINWDAIEHTEKLRAAIVQVAEDEGILNTGSGGLGFTTRDGELLRALIGAGLVRAEDESQEEFEAKPKRPLVAILDEFSRRRDDGGALQQFYEVVGGTRQSCEIEGGLGKKYYFEHSTLVDTNSFFFFTSNSKTPDEPDVKPTPGAIKSRLPSVVLNRANEYDYTLRFQQILTGAKGREYTVPITFLYDAQKEKWQADETNTSFAGHLSDVLKFALTPEQAARIPSTNYSLLGAYDKVMSASQRLAGFFTVWQELTTLGTALRNDENLRDVTGEIDQWDDDKTSASANTQVDLRLLQILVKKTLYHNPVQPVASYAQKDYKRPVTREPEEEFGTRLVRELIHMIHQRYPAGSKTRQFLDAQMIQRGIAEEKHFEKDTLKEAPKSSLEEFKDVRVAMNTDTVETLLNIPPHKKRSTEHLEAQEALVRLLRDRYRGNEGEQSFAPDVPAESILPLKEVGALYDLWKEKTAPRSDLVTVGDEVARYAELPMVEVEIDKSGQEGFQALGKVKKVTFTSLAGLLTENENYQKKEKENPTSLICAENFLLSLSMPNGAHDLLPHLWKGAAEAQKGTPIIDYQCHPVFAIRTGTSPSGLAYCNLTMTRMNNPEKIGSGMLSRDKETSKRYVMPVEVIHCIRLITEEDTSTVLVGDMAIDAKLSRSLKAQGVHYYCRSDQATHQELCERLDKMTKLGDEQSVARRTTYNIENNIADTVAAGTCERFLQYAFRQCNITSPELSEAVFSESTPKRPAYTGQALEDAMSLERDVRNATDAEVKETSLTSVGAILTKNFEKDGIMKPSYIADGATIALSGSLDEMPSHNAFKAVFAASIAKRDEKETSPAR